MPKQPNAIWKNSATHWTLARAKNDPRVQKRADGHYIDDKRIVFTKQEGLEIIKEEYKKVPPSTGYLRFYSYLCGVGGEGGRFVGLRREWVQTFLADAETRQLYRRLHKPSSTQAIVAKSPGSRLQVDLKFMPATYKGSRRLVGFLLIVDLFSKWIFAYPVTGESADECIKAFTAYFEEIGPELAKRVKNIQSDNGSGLSSEEFTKYIKDRGIKLIHGKAYSAQSQGAVERAHQGVAGMCTSMAETRYGRATAWNLVLEDVVDYINNTWTRTTRTTPERAFNAPEGEPDEKIKELLQNAAMSRRHTMLYSQLSVGDSVRVSVRVDGDAKTKGALKDGKRKGYLRNWSFQTYTIAKRRGNTYSLVNESQWGYIDRLNLLYIPTDTPYREASPEAREKRASSPRAREPATPADPRPTRAKKSTQQDDFDYEDVNQNNKRPRQR